MAFVVDTNVLIAAFNRDSPGHPRASSLVGKWMAGPGRWYLTWPILYEFLRVATHPAVFRRPASLRTAWSFVEGLLTSPFLQVLGGTERHPAVVRELLEECPWASGSILHDFPTVAVMREHGVKEIRTADTDFLKFRFLRVVNPLA